MNLIMSTSSLQTVSLKQLFVSHQTHVSTSQDITATITIEAHASVTIEDDLTTWSDVGTSAVIKHTLSFVLMEGSTLRYHMKIAPDGSSQQPKKALLPTTIEKTIQLKLAGKHAQAHVICACFGSDSNTFKFNTLQDHHAQEATSNVLIKGVLDDASKLICNSMITIQKGAQRTNAEQANKNILLSKKARAISIPQLEIEANDVKCKHGAAVSQLSGDHIFYLQSRGLDRAKATQSLIEAFLN